MLSVLLGLMGIAGAVFMALLGLAFGLAGLVVGTLSHHVSRRKMSAVGIGLSSLAIVVGLGVWTYAVNKEAHSHHKLTDANSATSVSANISTPCYSLGLFDQLNVKSSPDSCDIVAFNGPTINASTNAYKVYAHKSNIATAAEFVDQAKQAIEKDVQVSLPAFKIDNEGVATFAASPAYEVTVSDKARNISIVEAAVLHKVTTGENVFILVHATSGQKADLQIMESQWQWK
jgi:hypothetical protein